MLITPPELYRRYRAALTAKDPKRDLMQQVDEYFTPSDGLLTGKAKLTPIDSAGVLSGELLDTTGSDLIEEYVHFVLGLQYISDVRWFGLKSKNSDSADDVNKVLSKQADRLHRMLDASPYYSTLSSIERDAVLHGHGLIRFEPDETNFVKCMTVEPTDLVILQDSFNSIVGAVWKEPVIGFEIFNRFPDVKFDIKAKSLIEESLDKTFIILATWMSTESFKDQLPADHKEAKFFLSFCAYPAENETGPISRIDSTIFNLKDIEYFNEQTVFPARDRYVRNWAYGLGIGRRALPKSRLTNKLMYNLLKLAGLQANPPRVQHPAITAEAGNQNGLREGQVFTLSDHLTGGTPVDKLVTLLQTTGQIEPLMNLYQLTHQQLVQLLPTASSIYKVARQSITEIQQRLEEQNKRLKPLRQTFLNEGPARHLKYLYNLAVKQGKFNEEGLTLPKEEEETVEAKIDVSMLQSFRQDKMLRAAQALGIVSNFISLQPSAADLINADKAMELAFDSYQALDLLETRARVTEKRQAQLEQMQQQQLLQEQQSMAATDASNTKVIDTLLKGENV